MLNKIKRKIKLIYRFLKIRKHLEQNKKFWNEYYKKNRLNSNPSPFAEYCLSNYMKKDKTLLELGCGNGRDSFLFAQNDISVVGIDIAHEEISYLNSINKLNNLKFESKSFPNYVSKVKFDYVYSRFTIHSISELEEELTITNSYKNLKDNGLFFIEVRSIKDNMFTNSKKITDNEGETDHYRRFINYEEMINKLKLNKFEIVYSIESNGLAKYEDQDPVVIRIIAKKK